ncbi:DNA helicase [Gordonia phage Jumbo]|uniref:DNA helicase n=1 Tax=Gordonia phage Jumbo TaxID=1887650 RepID=A0A1B3B0M9_9CAUD|nr:DNA helicase [Gordonia phage Jumbo]AOE44565.1 DNA helicase [Gordonia phage Jumbo]
MSLENRNSIEPYVKDSIKYYQHQVEGIRRAAAMQSFLLADEMGLGKSLQSLTVYGIDLVLKRSESLLIVAPTTLKRNWLNEIENFMGDCIHVTVVPNTTPKRREKVIQEFTQVAGPRVLIINYEQVKPHLEILQAHKFDIVIFDEAHMLKNPTAQRTKSAHALADTITRKFLLTGSPILNHVNDLWSLTYMISPKAAGSYYGFLNNYAVYGGYENKQIIATKNEMQLNQKLAEIMIRRLKKDVLDLPEVQYITRAVGLTPKQQKLYDEVLENLQISRDDNGEPEDIGNVLTKFMRLKQISGTTATVLASGEDHSDKLDAAEWDAINMVKDGNRVVVFTQWRQVQAAYVERLLKAFEHPNNKYIDPATREKKTYPVYVLHGDIKAEDRQGVVDAWTENELPGVIVCIYSVAGVGLNMTSARYCQRLDLLFNPPLNQQAVDRLHRIGADKTQAIQVLDYKVQNSVEDRVDEILGVKKKTADSIVETDPLVAKAIAQAMMEEKEKRGK